MIKIKSEINEVENRKTKETSMKPKPGFSQR